MLNKKQLRLVADSLCKDLKESGRSIAFTSATRNYITINCGKNRIIVCDDLSILGVLDVVNWSTEKITTMHDAKYFTKIIEWMEGK